MTGSPSAMLLSTSKIFGGTFLEYCLSSVKEFLNKRNVKKILFIPYALPDYDAYACKVKDVFESIGLEFQSIHKESNPISAVNNAEAIFVGGGNTFLLLKTLYDKSLIEPIRQNVFQGKLAYIGSSAGTNVATISIATTNDMPIVHTPSLRAINLIPFNINPHYLDPDPSSVHMGETREERIAQYQEMPRSYPVLGLREGSWLLLENNTLKLKGLKPARLFTRDGKRQEIAVDADLTYLMKSC